ncbi:MAG: hypothetical protein ACQEP1_04155 [Nanobdellota archaeon]
MNSLKIFAIMATFLIVFFPLNSALSFAQITSVDARGESDVDGFLKGDEAVTFEAIIEAPDKETAVTTDQVSIELPSFDSTSKFSSDMCMTSSCTKMEATPEHQNSYKCTCGMTWVPKEPFDAVVKYNEYSHQKKVCIDSQSPQIHSVEISQAEGGLEFDYNAEDISECDSSVGIKEIRVFDGEDAVGSIDISQEPGTKDPANDAKVLDYSKDGEHDFNIKVRDNFWEGLSDNAKHADYVTQTFTTDFTKPDIKGFEFRKEGQEVTHIPSSGLTGELSVIVDDANLEKVTLLADENNDEIPVPVSDCTPLHEGYNCTITGVTAASSPADINVTATDKKGNIAEAQFGGSFTKDETALKVNFIGKENTFDGDSYFKEGENTFIMNIEEAGSGLSPDDVFLDMSSLRGKSSENVPADRCEEGWTCYWDVDLGEGNSAQDYYLYVNAQSKDIAGNTGFKGKDQARVYYDGEKPEIKNLSIKSVTENGLLDFHKSNDVLKIEATVSDNVGVDKAVANMTELIGESSSGYGEVEGSCSEQEGDYKCTWETDPIRNGHSKPVIDFEFHDPAGNVLENETEVEIYNPTDDAPDCYDIEFHDILPVEYSAVKYMSGFYLQMAPFNLKEKGCDGQVLDYRLAGDCTAGSVFMGDTSEEGEDYSGFIQFPVDPSLIRDAYDGGGDSFRIPGGDKECYLAITPTKGDMVYNTPEVENVSLDVEIASTIDSPGAELGSEIEDVIDQYNEWSWWYRDLKGFIDILSDICTITSIISGINGALGAVITALSSTGILQPAATALAYVKQVISWLDSIFNSKIASWVCALVQCTAAPEEEGEGTDEIDFEGASEDVENEYDVQEEGKELGEGQGSIDMDSSESSGDSQEGSGESDSEGDIFDSMGEFMPEDVSVQFPGGLLPVIRETGEAIWKGMGAESLLGRETVQSIEGEVGSFPYTELEMAKKSYILSIVGICLPGFVYKSTRHMQLKCWKSLCYYEAANTNFPKSVCDDLYSYRRCMEGELAGILHALLGATGLGEFIERSVGEYLNNPSALIYVGTKKGINYACDSNGNAVACGISSAFNLLEASMQLYSTVMGGINIISNLGSSGEPDYCEQLKDAYNETKVEGGDDDNEGMEGGQV